MNRAVSSLCLVIALGPLALGCSKKASADQGSPPATEKAPPQPTAPLPAEIAGFRFGMSVAEFEEQCKKVGKPNPLTSSNDPDTRKHTCDGVEVEPGMRLNVFLGFCSGDTKLCEINYWTNRNAVVAYPMLNEKFLQRFGPPTDKNDTLRDDGLREQCAKDGGKIRHTWWWGTPSAVTGRLLLTFDCKDGGKDQFVGAYFDDTLGSAAQVKYAKGKGVWPF